jgi:hypothetical protein
MCETEWYPREVYLNKAMWKRHRVESVYICFLLIHASLSLFKECIIFSRVSLVILIVLLYRRIQTILCLLVVFKCMVDYCTGCSINTWPISSTYISEYNLLVSKLQTGIIRDKFQVLIPSVVSYKFSIRAPLLTRQSSRLYSNSCQVVRSISPFTGAMVSEMLTFSSLLVEECKHVL